jgi:hypothetical protein
MDYIAKLIENKKILAVVIICLVLLGLASSGKLLNILPSFEGLQGGVEGARIYDTLISVDDFTVHNFANSQCYWISGDLHNAVFYGEAQPYFWNKPAGVRIEASAPVRDLSNLITGQKINYWIQEGSTLKQVEGQVNVYNMHVTISAVNTGYPACWFKADSAGQVQIWLGLIANTWDKAFQPSETYGSDQAYAKAYEYPLAVYIENFGVQDAGLHGVVEPMYEGRYVTLYSTPQISGSISDLRRQYESTSGSINLNSTLNGNTAPDSGMQKDAYFTFTLTNFGTTQDLIGQTTHAPVINYNLKVYTLQFGKYTYINPDQTPWQEREPESTYLFKWIMDAWQNFFENPLSVFGLGVFSFLLIVGVIALVLFWFVGTPKGSRGRRY